MLNKFFKKINTKDVILLSASIFIAVLFTVYKNNPYKITTPDIKSINEAPNPLSIDAMRNKTYPGSDFVIEETLSPSKSYSQYIASYKSEGYKLFGLLTVPTGKRPTNGWPAIIFNHGYIPPEEYKTTERYVAYVDAFASNGYIVFKPDYRGNGNSEGNPEGAYYSPAYTEDVLNALASMKKYKDTDKNNIGMWGHSMGGNITLRSLVVNNKDIKAAVIWGGVVGTYDDLLNKWRRTAPFKPSEKETLTRRSTRQSIIDNYKTPRDNPTFWNSIDPTSYLKDITTPLQIHTGLDDEEVPPLFSEHLYNMLKQNNKYVELFEYEGADHNISGASFTLAMQRSVDFFDSYLK